MLLVNPYRFGGPAPEPDPYFSSVKSLLHFNGTNGSESFIDTTGRVWVPTKAGAASANAHLDTSQKLFGTASYTGSEQIQYIYTGEHVDWDVGDGDFTFEFAVRFSDLTGTQQLFGWSDTVGSGAVVQSITIQKTSANKFMAYGCIGPATIGLITGTTTVEAARWYRLAYTRNFIDFRLFVDGVAEGGTVSQAGGINSTSSVRGPSIGNLGILNAQTQSLLGNIDEFRYTKGVARYTSNYTPATEPFPDS